MRPSRSKRFKKLKDSLEKGDVESMRELVRRNPFLLSRVTYPGYTILGLAASDGCTKAVSCLLEEGDDPNRLGAYSLSPLHGTIFDYHSLPSMALLITAGAELEAEDSDGNTALMRACNSTNLEAAALLLSHGANLTHKNKDGMTALDLLTASYNYALTDKKANRQQISRAKLLFELIEIFSDLFSESNSS